MTLPQPIQLLRDYVNPRVAMYQWMPSRIRARLEESPIDPDDFDLNPHLSFKWVCQKVAEDMRGEGFECTEHDVTLFWLTTVEYDGGSFVRKTTRFDDITEKNLDPRPEPEK